MTRMNPMWLGAGALVVGVLLFAFFLFGGGAGLQAGGNIQATPGGLVDVAVSQGCVLSVAQTLAVGSYNADKPGTTIATPSVQVFSDAATGKLNPGNMTTQPGYKYKAWAVKANYFGAADDITTGCVASPQLSLYQKAVDTAVSSTSFNANGVTLNTQTANQTIGSSGVGSIHLKLQQSASYTHLSGANNKFSVFLTATNVTDWDTTQTVVSFDGKECTTYAGAQPTALTTGVLVKGWDCDGDFSAIDGNLHTLDVRLAAANGVNPDSQSLIVNFVGNDLYQDTVTGVFKVGGVKNDGSAIQTMQTKTVYVG